jgi:hypothetical protein
MELQSTPEYRTFVSHRKRVNERLRDTGSLVDDWIFQHEKKNSTLAELALLQGLLQERTDLLQELADLDMSFMNSLLIAQTRAALEARKAEP